MSGKGQVTRSNYSKLRKFDTQRKPPPPLLKWIGSKHKIAQKIVQYVPHKHNAYIEPFLGSGAILGTLAPKKAIAGDNLNACMCEGNCFGVR